MCSATPNVWYCMLEHHMCGKVWCHTICAVCFTNGVVRWHTICVTFYCDLWWSTVCGNWHSDFRCWWFEDEKHLWLLVIWSELHGHPLHVLWVVYYYTSTVNRDIIASENLTRYLRASPQSHIVTVWTHTFSSNFHLDLLNLWFVNCGWIAHQDASGNLMSVPTSSVFGDWFTTCGGDRSGGNGELLQVEIWSNLIRSLRLWSESGQVVTWCQFQSPQSWSSVEVLWSTSGCHHSWSSRLWCESS